MYSRRVLDWDGNGKAKRHWKKNPPFVAAALWRMSKARQMKGKERKGSPRVSLAIETRGQAAGFVYVLVCKTLGSDEMQTGWFLYRAKYYEYIACNGQWRRPFPDQAQAEPGCPRYAYLPS